METYLQEFQKFVSQWPVLATALRILGIVIIGLPLLAWLSRVLSNRLKKRFSQQTAMVVQKSVFYAGILIAGFMILHELGFQLKALLGAAGVAGIVIGIASQTSMSNVISGLFLLSERPFEAGDFIQVGETRGVVISVDLLSVKLRTLDNRFVRLPNELMIKTEVINITHFPIRRFEMTVGVAYKEDIGRVLQILHEVADQNPYALDEPEPLIQFVNFGDSALQIFFGVWFAGTDYFKVRGTIVREIKERLDKEGIEIPFPHRTLYTGAITDPFPVRVIEPEDETSSE